MPFILARFLPYLLPLFYLIIGQLLFYLPDYWWLILLLMLGANLFYFWLLRNRQDKKADWLFLFYAEILAATGFLNLLILENKLIINIFLLLWSAMYFFYLEAYFHYFYPRPQPNLFALKNLIAYFNVVIIFFLLSALINFNIFFNLPWLWILFITFGANLFLLRQIFFAQGANFIASWQYLLVIDAILTELLLALSFWPVSFYVIAAVYTLAYYCLISLSLWHYQKILKRRIVWRQLLLAAIALLLILTTAKWF